ncbi:hypothetical protein Mal4_25290 [Maioricimonas rarisocia]|uniref:Planctomycete cytochrome C n=1 Tax=Maioricimonas rarisocia TaxID=2528026 RepID=A0A517Z6Y2_9PLAN|nr:DUF1592 domain-containing protein [Maioricimonas rarisocia]QDU38204.1 hypothetical protein Mal4_25290 [Maioricimonas rarisocia]
MRNDLTIILTALGCALIPTVAVRAADQNGQDRIPAVASSFIEATCLDCHDGPDGEAGLDLRALAGNLDDGHLFEKWVRVHDRVKAGEMPPPDSYDLAPAKVDAFVSSTADWLRDHQEQKWASEGRVPARRLTRLQIERTLHDLLGIDIPIANRMPEEQRTGGFTTVAAGQAMSHFQIEKHVAAVDRALEEAFRRALTPPDTELREMSARDVARRNPKRRTREPEMVDGLAVVWSSRLTFYGRLPATTAKEDGWYRFRIKASSLNTPEDRGVWCAVRRGFCVSSAPLRPWVGGFEATDEPQEWTFETWLPKGEMLEVRPGDATLKIASFRGGQVGAGEGGPQNVPGVAIHSVTMERIHRGPDDETIRTLLFGDLEVQKNGKKLPTLKSDAPKKDAARLVRTFARRAFRRPVNDDEVAPYITVATSSLADGDSLLDALRAGYRAVLTSPRFMYFREAPGALNDYALADRLSYFLWNRMPDEELMKLAEQGRLSDPQVLHEQIDRMLNDPRGERFVEDFAAEWLDLSEIDFTEPDRRLYREFDIIVQQSMLQETHAFLDHLLREDLSVANLIDSDFTFLNSRLARFYDIDRIEGDELQQVALKSEDRRGGLLTHGSILKVTANGTNTSPVIRGVWINERLLGVHIPPPPENVPAIEPDIRGATTIREMLAKHRSIESCAACHVKIDPPGFALENFDPAGQWRDRYPLLAKRRPEGGPEIDPSYELEDGREFSNFEEFQSLIVESPEQIARNVAEKLLTYGTGAPVGFADRPAIDRIVAQAAESDYGFRSLLHAAIASPVFTRK